MKPKLYWLQKWKQEKCDELFMNEICDSSDCKNCRFNYDSDLIMATDFENKEE